MKFPLYKVLIMAPDDIADLMQFAKEVYKAVGGRECPIFKDADEFVIPSDFVKRAIAYWVEEGVMGRVLPGTNEVCITHEGVAEIASWRD